MNPADRKFAQPPPPPTMRDQNRARAKQLVEEALSGAAVSSGTASPEQEGVAQGALGGLKPLSSPLARQGMAGGTQLMGFMQGRFPMQSPQQISAQNQGGDIDTFMHAISAQESSHNPNAVNKKSGAHGQFQIMPSNWANWAQEAGLGRNAERTAENQNIVARHKMQEYYNKYGSWDAVAVAWFAGPDRARRYNEGDKSVLQLSDGNMTVGEYIAKMQRGMSGGGN